MLSLVAFGIFMGIAFAAPPGIVTAETFRRGVARGFPAALAVQLGSLIGDATYCLLALAGVAVLVQNPITQRALGIVSVFFLMYLALTGIVSELRTTNQSVTSLPDASSRITRNLNSMRDDASPVHPFTSLKQSRNGAFITGMFLSLTNPWAIGFWLSLGGTLASYGAMESNHTIAFFFTGFFGACLAWAFAMAFLIGITRKALPPKFGKWISLACSAVIGVLGIGVAYQVLELFLKG